MKYIYQQYLDNVVKCHRIAKANRFSGTEQESKILDEITNNAKSAYRLRLENDRILNEIVFSKRAEELTGEDVLDLQEFTESLLTFVYQNDVGIAYRIHRLLFEYARINNDLDLYIKELYHIGISLFYLSPSISAFGINLNGSASTAYLREGASYLDRIEEIESETTRTYVIRLADAILRQNHLKRLLTN